MVWKKARLTPFDAETILMIKSITGYEPEITEKAELFEMKMYVDDKDEYIVKAAIDAVIGRYGMRVRAVEHGTRYIRHKKRPGIITGALVFMYIKQIGLKLAPHSYFYK